MHYDYIIVGAGSSGATLAARLSEDPRTSVLLLEAGPDFRPAELPAAMRVLNPNGAQSLATFAMYRWPDLLARRTSIQEPRPYLRGRGVGGSSIINGQVAIRGMPEDFDAWEAQGCTGWSARDVLPAFIRLENDLDFGDAPYHGQAGPNPIYRTPAHQWGSVDVALRDAALELGYGWAEDHNAPGATGTSPYAINGLNGLRVTVNDAYLEPARKRANLTIQADSLVERVLFDDHRARASGVRVRIDGEWVEHSGHEIILSAGAVHTPTILQRSGIGPRAVLEPLGIDVLYAAPTGENLIDHPFAGLLLDLVSEVRGTSTDARHTNCCVRYSSGLAGSGENDMILMAINLLGAEETGLKQGMIGVSAFQTFSRGTLRITSRDPEAQPEIELNMLSDERDLVRMRDGVRRLVRLVRQPAITSITEAAFLWPTTHGLDTLEDDPGLDRWLLEYVNDTYHPVGTCRMGSPEGVHTVVDPDCRVIGVDNLRVVDASIMPEIPRANLQLTCVMLAEHMADRLRRDV